VIVCQRCGTENPDSSRFCSSCGAPLEAAAAQHETRKTVTVLFCDAAASTSAGERIDAESLRAVMTRYFDEMRGVVERHGGVVEKFIGDAMMAVFGVPRVHEDDALRAVRASLEIRDRLRDLDEAIRAERGLAIEWRTGVNTGEVIAGDTASGHRFVSGDAVNVAARLEQAAQPGEILIGADTRRLVQDEVRVEQLEPLALKGKDQPVPAYRLLGPADEAQQQPARLQSPVVGRERQLRQLDEAWDQVVNERICHLFTILGAAGVGKSRVVNDFVERRGAEARAVYGRCLAYGDGITYWPLGEIVRTLAELSDTDDAATGRAKVEALLEGEDDASAVAERIGGAIGLIEARATPQETAWAARRLFEMIASRQPLVIVMDDVQWAEPALLDLIDDVATWAHDAPILLICLAREELLDLRAAWGGGKRYATTITLEPLSDSQSGELVSNLVGGADLPESLRQRIASASEGNPLFVEELLGMLIDEGALVAENGHWRPARDLAELTVPPTIAAVLAARLDGLPSTERAVLERGAVEGKVFHRGAVSELGPEPERTGLPVQLLALTRKELLRPDRSEFAGEEAYRFRHLLIRDAAYQAMPKATRADLHARFVAWLEHVAGDRVAEYEEIIGYHLEQAYRYRAELGPPDDEAMGLARAASERLGAAGQRAARRGDVHAALGLLRRAVELLPEEDARRVALLPLYGDAIADSGDLPAADRVLSRALELATAQGDALTAARAERVLLEVRSSSQLIEIDEILARSRALATEFERLGDRSWRQRALLGVAFGTFVTGQAKRALELLDAMIESEALDQSEADPRDVYAAMAAFLFWGPTPVDEAIARLEATWDRMGPDPWIEHLLFRGIGALYGERSDFERARELLERSRARAVELGHPFRAAGVIGFFLGPTEVLAGNAAEAAEMMREAWRKMTATGDRSFASTVAGNLALALVDVGEMDEAEKWAKVASDDAAADDFASQASSLAAMGRVIASRGSTAEGERLARQAVEMTADTDYLTYQGAMLLHLASILDLQGRPSEADLAVAQAIGRFEAKGASAWVAYAERHRAGSGPAT
jgi:class 3 adenylate cyclase/tetratricopeptide (TPR) repeat protein